MTFITQFKPSAGWSGSDHPTLRVPTDARDWQPWLEEIGFLQRRHVTVRRRSLLRKGAVVVRMGHSTFALHPEEAACIWARCWIMMPHNSVEPNSESRMTEQTIHLFPSGALVALVGNPNCGKTAILML